MTNTRLALLASTLFFATAVIPAIGQVSAPQKVGILPVGPVTRPPPDSTLFTSYFFLRPANSFNYSVCGYTKQTEGCFGGGTIGPFGHVGAIIEGDESTQGNTATRNIFVIDDAAGNGTGVTLYVYTKTDVVSPSDDVTNVILSDTISLPLTGGPNTKSFVAGNASFLYIATNQGNAYVRVQKSNLVATPFLGETTVSSITSNQYGYVSLTFDSQFTGGSMIYGPDGTGVLGGGGTNFVVSNTHGVSTTSDIPVISDTSIRPLRSVRLKKVPTPTLPGE